MSAYDLPNEIIKDLQEKLTISKNRTKELEIELKVLKNQINIVDEWIECVPGSTLNCIIDFKGLIEACENIQGIRKSRGLD